MLARFLSRSLQEMQVEMQWASLEVWIFYREREGVSCRRKHGDLRRPSHLWIPSPIQR